MRIDEAARWLSERDNFLILTHSRPDGDTLCSAGALCYGLNKIGKTARILPNPETGERYMKYVAEFFTPEDFSAEHIVSVDTARETMITKGGEEYYDKVELAIDHHGSNSLYAENSCIDGDAAACGEMIYELLGYMGVELDETAAALLYIAVSTDTGCFAYNNTSSRTLEIASKLVQAGAPNGRLNKEFFRTKKRGIALLEGTIISNLDFYSDDRIAVATITQKLMEEYGVTESELEDIASLPGQIEGVKVGFTIKEQPDGRSKVSCRTVYEVDSNAICAKFDGGGHSCAAGCTINLPPDEAKKLIVEAARELL